MLCYINCRAEYYTMACIYALYGYLGVKLTTSLIARGYRKLCWAKIIFDLVARLAIKKVIF